MFILQSIHKPAFEMQLKYFLLISVIAIVLCLNHAQAEIFNLPAGRSDELKKCNSTKDCLNTGETCEDIFNNGDMFCVVVLIPEGLEAKQ